MCSPAGYCLHTSSSKSTSWWLAPEKVQIPGGGGSPHPESGMSGCWGVRADGVGVSLGLVISWGDLSDSRGNGSCEAHTGSPTLSPLCTPWSPMTLGLSHSGRCGKEDVPAGPCTLCGLQNNLECLSDQLLPVPPCCYSGCSGGSTSTLKALSVEASLTLAAQAEGRSLEESRIPTGPGTWPAARPAAESAIPRLRATPAGRMEPDRGPGQARRNC